MPDGGLRHLEPERASAEERRVWQSDRVDDVADTGGPASYEERFARFAMTAGAASSLVIAVVVAATGLGTGVLPGVSLGSLGCFAAYALAARGHLRVGIRLFLGVCAVGVWLASAGEPSGEGAPAAALSWVLLGVFASLLLPPRELVGFGAGCTLGAVTLVAWLDRLHVSDTLYPAAIVAIVFVATAFLTLAEIARHFRAMVERSREAERAARVALEARGRFLANMSHELRTPLNAILGYSELLLEDEPGSARADLERIHRSGRLLLQHIDAILDLARLEAGRVELVLEPVDLAAVLREVADDLGPSARARGNTVQLELPETLALTTDRGRVRQVLSNLLSNANKFTERGTITVRGRSSGDGVEVDVEDTGIGMSLEALGRVFEPFVQADASTTRRFGGTGLGLTLARDLTHRLGGALRVVSAEGRGTTFTVRLPVVPPGGSTGRGAAARSPSPSMLP